MPQFDTTTFASQIFWLVVTFAVVFVFAWRIVLPRIATTLESRQRKIGDDLARAGELTDQADEVLAAYEARLAEARVGAHEELHAAAMRAAAEAEKQNAVLADKLAADAAAARERIAAESAAAAGNIAEIAVDIARQAVERLIGSAPDSDAIKSAVAASVEDPHLMISRILTSISVTVLLAGPALAAEEAAHDEAFFDLKNPEFWVAVSFVFFLVALFKPIKKMLTSKLDGRTETIKSELDEAQRLREEAQHTLAEYQRKQRDALKEAEAILAEARAEAGRIEAAAAERTEELLRRREQQALDMIAAAEAQALADVRGLVADVAIEATRQLLTDATAGDGGDTLVDQAIQDLPSKLN